MDDRSTNGTLVFEVKAAQDSTSAVRLIKNYDAGKLTDEALLHRLRGAGDVVKVQRKR